MKTKIGLFQWCFGIVSLLLIQGSKSQEGKSIGLCDQPWTPVYTHDTSGWEIDGLRHSLQKNLENGHLCKVVFSSPTDMVSLPLDEFHLRGRDICGTSAWLYSDNGVHIDDDANWLPTVVCTTGHVSQANFTSTSLVRDVESSSVNATGTFVWYTKATSCEDKPAYSHFFDGSSVQGSLPKLVKLARASALTVKMRDRGYSFLSQNTKTFGNKLVTVQSLDHLSLVHTVDGMEHNSNPYYKWHGAWSSDGRRDVSRWFINDTTLWSHENEQVALDWFGDECWRKVMTVSGVNGDVTYGSLKELVMMIELGHMVRVNFDGYSLKAINVRIIDGVVVAMTTEEFARRGEYPRHDAPFFNSNTRIVYRLVHSTGSVRSYMFVIDNYTLSEKLSERHDISWYVDTRPWTQVYQTAAIEPAPAGNSSANATSATSAPPPTTQSPPVTYQGKNHALIDAMTRGASVRVGVKERFSDGQVFLDLDNIRTNLETNQTIAQAVKGVAIERKDGETEYSIPAKVSELSFLITSEGLASSRKLQLATRDLLINYVSDSATITWFVNQ